MASEWMELETSVYQDHVIAHVVGATVLGYFETEEALHLVLDIGLLWTVYVNAEMALMPESVAISDLEIDKESKEALLKEAALLHDYGREADGLAHITAATVNCLITEVSLKAFEDGRRVVIEGEEASLLIESSLPSLEMNIRAV